MMSARFARDIEDRVLEISPGGETRGRSDGWRTDAAKHDQGGYGV